MPGQADKPALIYASNPDRFFEDANRPATDFRFNAKVADVFDDMVSRSVPFYEEIQRMVCELAADFATPGTNLYDIGCSTATTMLAMDARVDPSVTFIGVDNSKDMLAKARHKIAAAGVSRPIELVCADLHDSFAGQNASVITMLLTLQFARPLHRERIVRDLYNALNDQGVLILVEKLTCEDTAFNRLFIDHYYGYKRRMGYSDIEISKKREALENVLIPYRLEENVALLKSVGFRQVETFFRWYNFCGLVAMK
jgi:tRNA (cmo5U34)-methyltransferase